MTCNFEVLLPENSPIFEVSQQNINLQKELHTACIAAKRDESFDINTATSFTQIESLVPAFRSSIVRPLQIFDYTKDNTSLTSYHA